MLTLPRLTANVAVRKVCPCVAGQSPVYSTHITSMVRCKDPPLLTQVVVLDAGGNDFNSGSAPAGWNAAYKNFLLQVRNKLSARKRIHCQKAIYCQETDRKFVAEQSACTSRRIVALLDA